MNPEHLDQVTDNFHNVFPVWVNKHVTSAQCSVWLCHSEVSNAFVHCSTIPGAHYWTLARLGMCLPDLMAGCWFFSIWKNHPSGSFSASGQTFACPYLCWPLCEESAVYRGLCCALQSTSALQDVTEDVPVLEQSTWMSLGLMISHNCQLHTSICRIPQLDSANCYRLILMTKTAQSIIMLLPQ